MKALADRFGTPLFNHLRIAVPLHLPAVPRRLPPPAIPDVEILFANKSSNGLAIRHIMNQEARAVTASASTRCISRCCAGTNPRRWC